MSTGEEAVASSAEPRACRTRTSSASAAASLPPTRPNCSAGWTLARAHARSGDPIVAIAAYIGDDDVLPEAVAEFAELYADQTEHDYQAFLGPFGPGGSRLRPVSERQPARSSARAAQRA